MKTGAKVTIGIVGIIAVGIIGFLISNYQINANKADKEQISATAEQGGAGTGQGGANASKALDVSADEKSKEQAVMDKDEEEGWNAIMEVIDEVAETPDTRATAGGSGTLQTTSSGMEDSETDQDQPEMEYHESYNTFINITRDIAQIKSEMDRVERELNGMYEDWKRNVRDPKNPTAEEKAQLEEIGSVKEESGDLWGDYNSLASELVSEVEVIAPGAIQTESQDFAGKGTSTIVRIDYNHIQSELGAPPGENGAVLAQFFADFQMESWEGDYGEK